MAASSETRRARKAPEVVKRQAVVAARDLLLAGGPAAVTVKAVADRLGMSHVNLLYHFGSAGGLQTALMAAMVAELSERLESAAAAVRCGELPQGALVDVVFAAFSDGGAARLAAALVLAGETDELAPIATRLSSLVSALEARALEMGAPPGQVRLAVLATAYQAFADALIGPVLREMLGLSAEAAPLLAKRLVVTATGAPDRP